MRRIVRSGLVNGREVRVVHRGGFKVRQWSGPVQIKPRPVPDYLDWEMYCGPSPLKPFHPPRFGGMHRGYWDYDGGGLGDMGQHALDPITYRMGKDETSPVEVTAHAPPAHPEVAGMWGWVRFKYEDGVELGRKLPRTALHVSHGAETEVLHLQIFVTTLCASVSI